MLGTGETEVSPNLYSADLDDRISNTYSGIMEPDIHIPDR